MRHWAVALGLSASGCAQLFGLDETSGMTVDPTRVSLSVERWSVGANVQKNPQDLAGHTASFLVDDGSGGFAPIAGEQTAPGMWSAPIAEGTPPVLFTLPDQPMPIRRLWQMPARDRRGVFLAFEHPSPQDPLPMSELMLTATLPSPYLSTETFRIEAIGAWMAQNVTPVEAPNLGATTITATVPYASFARMTGAPPARITSADVVVVERYVGNQLTGVYQVPAFDQTDGVDPIAASISAVATDKQLMANVTPMTYAQRFGAVRPAVAAVAQSWTVNAAPGWSIGSRAGPRLHAGTIAASDMMIATMFGNPFESLGWRSLLQVTTAASRTYMLEGMAAMTLGASMVAIAEPTGTLTVDMPAGLPINIRANQIPLSTDGMTVALDLTKPVEIDAITDKPGGTVFGLTIVEVALSDDMMMVERKTVLDAVTTGEPKLRIPPELFEVGRYYYLDFRTVLGGYTNAAMGDLQNLTLPYAVSRADSAVFQVVAP